ncbi:hypothetical protein TWF970_007302 [Orbilia oligospora]|uniref:BTB domain-containing protein n=1 Tax=Orbilia oligospora TaxID=2813651 RepID=A0A7C8VPL0_ORBOL|nr:hypothetical protein TWF970_007302 [Orbilia oligospora]
MDNFPTYDIAGDVADVVATLYTELEDDKDTIVDLAVFNLSSQVLSITSPIFRAMFNPVSGFSESKLNGNNMKEIRFVAPSLEAGVIAMSLLHHRYDYILETPSVPILSSLATFADYYHVQSIFKRLVASWITALQSSLTLEMYTAEALWVGIVFQNRAILEHHLQGVFKGITKKGDTYMVGRKHLHAVMDRYSDAIWNERERLIQKFVDEVSSKLEVFRIHLDEKFLPLPATPAASQSDDTDSDSNSRSYSSSDPSDSGNSKTIIASGIPKCDVVQLGTLQALRLQIGFPERHIDHMTFETVMSIFVKTTKQNPIDNHHDCRKYLKGSVTNKHISCNTVEGLHKLAVEIEKTDVRKTLLLAFKIEGLS